MLDLFLTYQLNVTQTPRDMLADVTFTERRIGFDEVGEFVG